MALCMKMNKRMQLLENKYSQVQKRMKFLLSERREMIDLLQQNIPNMSMVMVEDDQDLEISLITDIWREHTRLRNEKYEEQLKSAVASLEEKYKLEISNLQQRRKSVEIHSEEPTTSDSVDADANEIQTLIQRNEVSRT